MSKDGIQRHSSRGTSSTSLRSKSLDLFTSPHAEVGCGGQRELVQIQFADFVEREPSSTHWSVHVRDAGAQRGLKHRGSPCRVLTALVQDAVFLATEFHGLSTQRNSYPAVIERNTNGCLLERLF